MIDISQQLPRTFDPTNTVAPVVLLIIAVVVIIAAIVLRKSLHGVHEQSLYCCSLSVLCCIGFILLVPTKETS